jgi:GDP-L-fucose synthase
MPSMPASSSSSYWRGRRVVVAGGTGFLGRRIAQRLLGLHANVISCSRSEGCDLRDPEQAKRFFGVHQPQVVFNCAANQGGVEYQRLCPGTILYDNALIQLNTMEACRSAGVAHYVNLIPACAYPAAPQDGLYREDELEAGAMHESADNYGATKRLALMQAKHYARQFGFRVTSVALANTYGPGDHFDPQRSHVLAALLRKFFEARRDNAEDVTVWGRGVAERDLLYVDDAVTGTLLIVEHCPDIGLVNIGSGRGHTVREIAETVRDVVGYRGRIRFDVARPEGPLKKTLDIAKLRANLNWTPPMPLTQGIGETLIWLEAHSQEALTAY